MEEHFDEIIEFAELKDFLDVPIKNFSSGMQARLGFAIATMVRPDILVVDEILSVGDYQFQQKCYERMGQMLSGGTTLLYVSHDVNSVRQLCDHAIWIDKGDVKMSGLVEEDNRSIYAYESVNGDKNDITENCLATAGSRRARSYTIRWLMAFNQEKKSCLVQVEKLIFAPI